MVAEIFQDASPFTVSKKKQLATVLVAEAEFNSALSRLLKAKPIKKNEIRVSRMRPSKVIGPQS